MNKRRWHHLITKTHWAKPSYFLILALASGLICVFALRANNQHMVVLRDAVLSADKNNTDVQKPLKELQAYVTTHMNTSLTSGNTGVYPPIQLKYTYERLTEEQRQQSANANTQLYTDAQHYCEQQNSVDFSGHNRVPCIEQYVQSHGGAQAPSIPDALYKFDFVSPAWSPDLAGWSLLISILSALAFTIMFALNRWVRS